ncbi:Crp/Fnr family transcriptional regulator [Castellaniella sp.]|uniref:Crp/Fnr family transcriptional regulator n=1 Tax=Castellaniella sp. TaxID=1955812 RepID=UPI00355EBF91
MATLPTFPSPTPGRRNWRRATADELMAISWFEVLNPAERARVTHELVVGTIHAGEYVCRVDRPASFWFGVIDGLLKVSSNKEGQGTPVTFAGVPSGSWFGEGTVLKREPYRYNVQALRGSIVAGLPLDSFHWLLEHSTPFNRFVIFQINERLGQFVAAREIEGTNRPNLRVARSLAAMFNPILNPRGDLTLRVTQQELGYLVGLSRQRINQALSELQSRGAIQVEYGGLRILDLEALRTGHF